MEQRELNDEDLEDGEIESDEEESEIIEPISSAPPEKAKRIDEDVDVVVPSKKQSSKHAKGE